MVSGWIPPRSVPWPIGKNLEVIETYKSFWVMQTSTVGSSYDIRRLYDRLRTCSGVCRKEERQDSLSGRLKQLRLLRSLRLASRQPLSCAYTILHSPFALRPMRPDMP